MGIGKCIQLILGTEKFMELISHRTPANSSPVEIMDDFEYLMYNLPILPLEEILILDRLSGPVALHLIFLWLLDWILGM